MSAEPSSIVRVGPVGVRVAVLAALFAGACNSSGKLLKIDEETLNSTLDHIDQSIPACTSGAASAARRHDTVGLGEQIGLLMERLRQADFAARSQAPAYTLIAGVGSTGSCGGSLNVDYSHESGITEYAVGMLDFCMATADGNLTVTGALNAKETGKPSDAGPVISAFDASSDGPIEVVTATDTISIVLDDAHTDYGVPAAWTPGVPDAENPDVTTVKSLTATFGDGREDFVDHLRIERVGSPSEVTVTEGDVGTRGDGYVRVRTPDGEPLVVQALTPISGALEFQGAGDTVLTARPVGAQMVFDLELDGAAFPRGVDCAAIDGLKSEALTAFLMALPLF